ncbi:MAG: MerR family transcriptional regulator [Denitromonas halophila]|jgi:DNA-binding transcriptional MerR regulator|nr:MAG: MerR family transcriptional regulator [Denitromonas halophila]
MSALPIAAVERDTGIPKDTLRVWERRYAFPQPVRDDKGERLYPAEQVEKLRLLRRLLDQGHRPGSIVAAPTEALAALLEPAGERGREPADPGIAALIDLVRLHRSAELRATLQQHLVKLGLQRFVSELVAPLSRAIGEAWLHGEIGVAEEHLFTEHIQNLLRSSISSLGTGSRSPRILMTTLPGEEHILGLLMVEAMLAPEGAQCISLGAQTPLADIAQAARDGQFDIVAVSFSAAFPARQAFRGIEQLRDALPASIALWAGGAALHGKRKRIDKVQQIAQLDDLLDALTDWRKAN